MKLISMLLALLLVGYFLTQQLQLGSRDHDASQISVDDSLHITVDDSSNISVDDSLQGLPTIKTPTNKQEVDEFKSEVEALLQHSLDQRSN